MLNFANLFWKKHYLGFIIGVNASFLFWLYLISDILSILCSLLVLYSILVNRTHCRALHNHIILLLLIIVLINELTSIPWNLYYLYNRVPFIETTIFYRLYFFFDYGIYTTQIILFAWSTIERHILIFHVQWISTRKKRIFVHYLPMMSILIYCLMFYAFIAFSSLCENSFDIIFTGGIFIPCLYDQTILGILDLLLHQIIPTLIIGIFSITLIGRVLRQKRRLNQTIIWRRHRKMTVQLLLISTLYLSFNIPWTILIFLLRYGFIENSVNSSTIYLIYVRTYVIFLFPFVCCKSLFQFRKKSKQTLLCRRRRQQSFPLVSLKFIRPINEPNNNIF